MPGKRDGIQLTQETVHVLAGQMFLQNLQKYLGSFSRKWNLCGFGGVSIISFSSGTFPSGCCEHPQTNHSAWTGLDPLMS